MYELLQKFGEENLRELVKLFSYDLNALQIAKITGLNRNTVNRFLKAIREKITVYRLKQYPSSEEIEVDESFFGAKRVKSR